MRRVIRWSEDLPRGARLAVLLVPLALVGTALVILSSYADRGVTRGIIALELVGDAAGAGALIGDGRPPLSAAELAVVRGALWADLAVITVYTIGLVVAMLLLVPAFRLQRLRMAVVPAMVVAALPGVLDLAEDGALAIALGRDAEWWYRVATALAISKFLLLVALAAVVVGGLCSAVSTPTWLHRRLINPPERDTRAAATRRTGLGIALSGGGVRAATYSLGTLQTLEDDEAHPIGWDRADTVTSVSGGSYMAGAWQLGRDQADNRDAWRSRPDGSTGPEETHLLNNLGYLTSAYPRGLPTEPGVPLALDTEASPLLTRRLRNRPAFWATILAGFVVNALAIAAVLLMIVIPFALLLRWLATLGNPPCPTGADQAAQAALCLVAAPRTWFTPVAWSAAWLTLALAWVLVGKLLRRSVRLLALLKYAVLGSVVMIITTLLLLIIFPLLIAGLAMLPGPTAWFAALAAAGGTLAAVARMLRKVIVSVAPMLGGVAFSALLLIAAAGLAKTVWFDLPVATSLTWLAATVGVVLATRILASPELWSMFAFYRGRLRSAYALRRTDTGQAVPYADDPDAAIDPNVHPEPALGGYPSRLIICAAAHATTKGIRTHYRIPALSFTFSPQTVSMYVPVDDQGATEQYRCTLDELGGAYPGAGIRLATKRITTMFAVALSGAAVSPAMGRFRIGPTSALLAFANIRLGAWLPNPRYAKPRPGDAGDRIRPFPRISLGYLFKEFLGIHDPTDAFVYVSDGGHWENSGVVELLRESMPEEIVMVDADAGRAETILQLSQAIDLAKLECDIDVYVDLEPLRGFPSHDDGPVFAERSVTLGAARQRQLGEPDRWALLWYCKPILTSSTPTPLLAHREIDREFPATSTLDQFFDTSTYLAYRDLGRYNAAQIHVARADLQTRVQNSADVADFLATVAREDDPPWVAAAFAALLDQRPPAEQEALFAHASDRLQQTSSHTEPADGSDLGQSAQLGST
jgi:hypothetical protein